jgi:hypothetical protein
MALKRNGNENVNVNKHKRQRPAGDGDNDSDSGNGSGDEDSSRRGREDIATSSPAATAAKQWSVKTCLPPVRALDPWLTGLDADADADADADTDAVTVTVTYVPPSTRSPLWPGWRFATSEFATHISNPREVAALHAAHVFMVVGECVQAVVDGVTYLCGVGELKNPAFVAAYGDKVAVTEPRHNRIVVFRYDAMDDAYVVHSRIGGVVRNPQGVAFLPDGEHIAVAETWTDSVAILTLGGERVRTIGGGGTLSCPLDVACFPNGDVAVADRDHARIAVFRTATGELVGTMQTAEAAAVAADIAAGIEEESFVCLPPVPSVYLGREVFTAVTVMADGRVAALDGRAMRTYIFQLAHVNADTA